jgi:hypothetical protein
MKSVTACFTRHARSGNVEGFRAFVDSPEFVQYLAASGKYRRSILRAYGRALETVERRARVVKPKPIGQGQTSWRVPGRLEKLRAAYARGLNEREADPDSGHVQLLDLLWQG